ncbi:MULTISPECIES: hypothetical protein [unclassified Rhizobium]|uniref:hypothetical protein n=1 Tax=unclassified Rhizobium TaxID=2613769 RepID=UPI00114797CF|nr:MULTISPECIES: hypothetical protein [unclassified Rhizobium]MDM9623262.1 hypothetical protein [Rhizobium sp. S96]
MEDRTTILRATEEDDAVVVKNASSTPPDTLTPPPYVGKPSTLPDIGEALSSSSVEYGPVPLLG